jgi:REP element-mobilizing transposase RayT
MGITHDTIPFTQEKIEESDVDVLVDEMLDNKSFQINQKFEKLDWKRTQEDAIKWREFTQLNVNPFKNFIENWVPPKYTPLKVPSFKNAKSDKVFVAVLSDLHFGSFANAKYMFNREGWTTQDTVKAVDKYAQQIVKTVSLLSLQSCSSICSATNSTT